ncbi:MAG: hypothetical protein HYX55_05805 [Chloroflexi bacterium]|nr:hypothetical protein [Chloroflexota bacterium]
MKRHEAETGGGLTRAPGCTGVLDTDSDMDLAGVHSISVQITRPGGRAVFDALTGLPTLPVLGDGGLISGGNAGGDVWAVKGDALVHLQYAMPVGVDDPQPLVVPLVSLVLTRL